MRKRLLSILIIALIVFSSYPAFAASEPFRIERTTVNGMNILLQKNNSEVAQITLLLKSGSGIELANKKGAAYIMNNFVYWILDASKSSAGSADVTTQADYTLITMTTLARDIKPTLERIKFLLSEPIYSYDVVVSLKESLSTGLKAMPAESKAYSDFTKEYYGPEHPYNDWPNPETVAAVGGPDVYKWYRQTYQPGNAILSISGGIKENIINLEKFFTNMKSETVDRHLIIRPVLLNQDKRLKQTDPNGRATSFCMGFSAPRIQDPEYPAFRVLAYYLAEYQHYFEELRVKDGLFYSAGVYYNYLEKPKAPNIAFITMTDPETLEALEKRTLEVVRKLMETGIAQNDIDKIIKAIQTEDEARKASGKGLATLNALSQYLQTQLIYVDALMPKLEQVKTADIKQAASKFLQHYIEVTYVPKKVEQVF
jgi:predicted Zn-dependent peptidase